MDARNQPTGPDSADPGHALLPDPLPSDRSAEEAEYEMVALFGSVLAGVLDRMRQDYGQAAIEAAEDAFIGTMVGPGASAFDEMRDRSDVRTYVRWLLGCLTIGQKYEIVESSPDSVRLKFTACPLATYFRSIGRPEFGAFFCHVDRPMMRAFNASMDFEISKTLMKGDDHCNHHFFSLAAIEPHQD